MNLSQTYKLSSASIRDINDVCESLEKLWESFDKLKSPPNFRHLVVKFRSSSNDKPEHVEHELYKSLIDTDLRYRKSNGIAVSRKEYIDMLLLEDQSVLQYFDWKDRLNKDLTVEPDRYSQPIQEDDFVLRNEVGPNEETQDGVSLDTNDLVASGIREHSWSFLDPPLKQDDLGSLGDAYRVITQIGRGGMGTVFLAEDTKLLRKVAIKVLHAVHDNKASEAQRRFLREARAMAAIESEHVITVYHVGEHNGIAYLVMPALRGETLGSRIALQHQMSQEEAARIAKEIAIGLSRAHKLGQIHRDIKPENVWLEEPDSKVKLLDFGLVRPSSDTFNTMTGTVVGTPQYMSPEQVKGEKVGATTDLFSLGTVLYQMLSGEPAFRGNSLHATLLAVSNCEYQSLLEKDLAVAPKLAAYVDQLLSKEPENRPPTADSVVQFLDSFVGSSDQAEATQLSTKTSKDSNGNARSKIWVGTAFFGFLILLSILLLKFRSEDGTVVVELGDIAIEQVEIDGNHVNYTRNGKSIEFKVNPGTHRLTLTTPSGDVLRTNLSDKKLTVYSGKNSGAIRAWVESGRPKKPNVTSSENVEQALQSNALRWILKHPGARASVTLGGGEGINVKSVEEIPDSPFSIYGVASLTTKNSDIFQTFH